MNQILTNKPYKTYRNGNTIILYRLNTPHNVYQRVGSIEFDHGDKFFELVVQNIDPMLLVPLFVNLSVEKGMKREQVIKYLESHGWVNAHC